MASILSSSAQAPRLADLLTLRKNRIPKLGATYGVISTPCSATPGFTQLKRVLKPSLASNLVVKASKDLEGAFQEDQLALQSSARVQRNLASISFWIQFALSLTSIGILIFANAFTVQNQFSSATSIVAKYLSYSGAGLALLSALFAHGVRSLADKLLAGKEVTRPWLVGSIVRNSMLNLIGIGAIAIGLQAEVGTLIAKIFLTPAQPFFGASSPAPLISLDVFTLQASSNALLSHIVSLFFINVILKVIHRPAPGELAPGTKPV